MTEELTAEERALLPISEHFPDGRAVAKLLRLYDEALARAEAAERALSAVHGVLSEDAALAARTMTANMQLLEQCRSAEYRLSEATALLERCRDAAQWHHPDAIALRECRAELESVRTTARKLHESLTSAYEDIESARADAEQLRAGHAECRAELEAERQEVELKQAALNTVRAERDTARVNEHKSAGDARLWKLRYDDECKRSEALTSVRALVESIEAEIERDCLPRDSYCAIFEMVRVSKGGGA